MGGKVSLRDVYFYRVATNLVRDIYIYILFYECNTLKKNVFVVGQKRLRVIIAGLRHNAQRKNFSVEPVLVILFSCTAFLGYYKQKKPPRASPTHRALNWGTKYFHITLSQWSGSILTQLPRYVFSKTSPMTGNRYATVLNPLHSDDRCPSVQ